MKVTTAKSHRGASELLSLVCPSEFQALLADIRQVPFQVRPAGKIQSNRYVCPIDQRSTNAAVLQQLAATGIWAKGRRKKLGPVGQEVSIEPDFELRRAGVFVEVEFGNAASMHRDFVKFECLAGAGLLHVGILVVPARRVARMMDPAIGHAGKASNLIQLMVPTYPLQVIEVDLDSASRTAIRAAYESARSAYTGSGKLVNWREAIDA